MADQQPQTAAGRAFVESFSRENRHTDYFLINGIAEEARVAALDIEAEAYDIAHEPGGVLPHETCVTLGCRLRDADFASADGRSEPYGGEEYDGVIREGSLTYGGNVIGPKAWRLMVTLSQHDDYFGAVEEVIDEAAAARPSDELDLRALREVAEAYLPGRDVGLARQQLAALRKIVMDYADARLVAPEDAS